MALEVKNASLCKSAVSIEACGVTLNDNTVI